VQRATTQRNVRIGAQNSRILSRVTLKGLAAAPIPYASSETSAAVGAAAAGVRMTRGELVKRLADYATRPLSEQAEARGMHQPVEPVEQSPAPAAPARPTGDLFVWFEDTASRLDTGRRGIAGLPESLLPWDHQMRVIERRYAQGHLHLLSAVRLRCQSRQGERIAAIYTAALSVGTVAWIGTGKQYELAWREMFPQADDDDARPDATPDTSCEI
jgi:hypothetical protein